MAETDPEALHEQAIVIDAVAPLVYERGYLDWYAQGGATAICPTVGGIVEDAAGAADNLGKWHRFVRENAERYLIVREAADIEAAKRSGRLGLIFHFQGTKSIEDRLDLIDAYAAMGLRVVQLAYNKRNLVGDGADERTDSGLSYFGLQVVERLNANRVAVDCAHTGYRTTRDAIENSSQPVIITHANAIGFYDNRRNVPDDVIRAIAARGGVVGTVGFPGFLGETARPTLDSFIDDIAYKADLVGIDHTGLGIDYYLGMDPVVDGEEAKVVYERRLTTGNWRPGTYPPPPHYFPAGIETPRTLPNLTRRLLERGFQAEDVRKVLGRNWLRIFGEIWG